MAMYIKPYRSRRIHVDRSEESPRREVHVPLDVRDEEDAFQIEMVVPGLKPEDLDIEILKNKIAVRGEFSQRDEDDNYLRQEIPTGTFRRVIKLPKTVDAEASEANLEHGILSLRVPLAQEALPRTIKVETN